MAIEKELLDQLLAGRDPNVSAIDTNSSGSNRKVQPRDFSLHMPPSTTFSTSNAIS